LNILALLVSLVRFCYRGRNVTNEATIVADRPDYAAMVQEVEAYTAQVVPRFHGEARDDVQLLFDGIQSGLEVVDGAARRINGGEPKALDSCLFSFRDTIAGLQHYEIEEKIINRLEEMTSDLNAWAGELRARGHAPRGPASAPL
jgi:hypothetical protein